MNETPIRLSVCLIVKNEEKQLASCLESIKDIADEIIVVDTGSSDKTVEIAESFSAKVEYFPWTNDFSEARNISIKEAKGEWILWLDADERLEKNSNAIIRTIISRNENLPTIYTVKIHNIKNNGTSKYLSNAHRLFNNHKGITFSGKIHEQISPSVTALKGVEKQSDIILIHYGYDLDDNSMAVKYSRNLELILKQLETEPGNAYYHFTAGKQYALLENYKKSAEHLNTALDLKVLDKKMQVSLLNVLSETEMKMGKNDSAKQHLQRSIQLFSNQVSAYYLLYKLSEQEGDGVNTVENLEILLEKNIIIQKKGSMLPNDILLENSLIRFNLGSAYYKLKRYNEALKVFTEIVLVYDNDIEYLERVVDCSLNTNNLQQAIHSLQILLKLKPQKQYFTHLGISHIKRKEFKEAISVYESALTVFPDMSDEKRLLAGLYAKTGNFQKAEALLKS